MQTNKQLKFFKLTALILIICICFLLWFLSQELEKIFSNENNFPITENYSSSKNIDTDFQVINIVDGDTIDVMIENKKTRIRLIGIDTPEIVHPNKPVECFGKEASKITEEKILNEKIYLESDSTQADSDRYGRKLRYIILKDGTNFNQWLIENGYAFEYTYNIPYKYQTQFQQAEKHAQENNLGLWNKNTCQNLN